MRGRVVIMPPADGHGHPFLSSLAERSGVEGYGRAFLMCDSAMRGLATRTAAMFRGLYQGTAFSRAAEAYNQLGL